MKQHLHTAAVAMPHSVPASRHSAATPIAHTCATTADKRRHVGGNGGTWPNTKPASSATVFAPYHQRPKDSVT